MRAAPANPATDRSAASWGATYPEQLVELRRRLKRSWILIPGFGAQGGGAGRCASRAGSKWPRRDRELVTAHHFCVQTAKSIAANGHRTNGNGLSKRATDDMNEQLTF